MFHPIGYLVDIHWLEEQNAKFKAHWFFHLIRAKISYGDDLIYGEIHLFWKKITFSLDLSEKDDNKPAQKNEKKSKESKDTEEKGIISKIKG